MVDECKVWYNNEMARDAQSNMPIINWETILLVAAKEETEQGW